MRKILTLTEFREIIKETIPKGLVVPEHDKTGHFYRHTGVDKRYASVTTKSGILESPHLKMWAANETVRYIDKNWDVITPKNKDEIFKAAVMSHQDQFEEAGDIGTQGHEIVDNYIKQWMETGDQPADIKTFITGKDYRLWAIARSAEMFCKDFDVSPVASEMFVAHTRHRYAGTLDSIMLLAHPVRKGDANCEHQMMGSPHSSFISRCFKCDRKVVQEFCLVDWKTSNSIDKLDYAMQTSAYWYAFFNMTGIRLKHIFIVRFDKKVARYQAFQVIDRIGSFRTFMHVSKAYDWMHDGHEKLGPLVPKTRILLN